MDNKLGVYIRQKRGTLSLRDCAILCNISHTNLDSIEKGYDPRTGKSVSVTTDTLAKIAKGIGADVGFLLSLNLGQDIATDIENELSEYDLAFFGEVKDLNDEQKKAVLNFIRFTKSSDETR